MISRRHFFHLLLGAGLGGALADLHAHETPFPRACRLRTVEVPAPSGWAGKTGLFVTDIHYGNCFGPADAAALNTAVRRESPEIVFLGGDLAQAPDTDLSGFFSAWAPGCPTVFSPGNHDQGRRGEGTVLAQSRDAGLTVLCNSREAWRGLSLIGLPSALRGAQRLSLLTGPGCKIVLAHEPDCWDRYRAPELLQLAGHTHGGQIRFFGRPICLPTLGRKYPLGVYDRPGGRLIVSAGIGLTDVPLRLNCPPQIIRLRFV